MSKLDRNLEKDHKEFWKIVKKRDRNRYSHRQQYQKEDPNSPVWRRRDFKAAYQHAKRMYLNGKEIKEIAEVTGFTTAELHRFSRGVCKEGAIGWHHEMFKWQEMTLEQEIKKARKTIGDMLEIWTEKIHSALQRFDVNNIQNVDEVLQAMKTFQALYEMERLEQNKPTAIFGYQELTRHNLKEKLQKLQDLGIPLGIDFNGLITGTEATPPLDPEDIQ